jgi:hypothetical protein
MWEISATAAINRMRDDGDDARDDVHALRDETPPPPDALEAPQNS